MKIIQRFDESETKVPVETPAAKSHHPTPDEGIGDTVNISTKPTPIRFKIWVLAQTGYVLDMLWHVRRDQKDQDRNSFHTLVFVAGSLN